MIVFFGWYFFFAATFAGFYTVTSFFVVLVLGFGVMFWTFFLPLFGFFLIANPRTCLREREVGWANIFGTVLGFFANCSSFCW